MPGPEGSSGSEAYAEFYAIMPPDNAATVAAGAPVEFPRYGPARGAITRLTPAEFLLPSIGTYSINFSVSVSEPGQLVIALDTGDTTAELPYATYGRATGTSQISGDALARGPVHRVQRSPGTQRRVSTDLFVPADRPITGEQTTLPVIGHSTGPRGAQWLRVMLPGRPNGSTGWIAQDGTRELSTGWRIAVDLAARRLRVYHDGRTIRTFQAVIGKPSTPTPTGQFFVEETVQMPVGHPGGPFALALSARSNVLQKFEGGQGQIAIHAMNTVLRVVQALRCPPFSSR